MSPPIRAAHRLASGHRTFERTGLVRQRFRRSRRHARRCSACPAGDPVTDTDGDHVLLTSVQIFPSSWLGWTAIGYLPNRYSA
jgi:hypothetical protein